MSKEDCETLMNALFPFAEQMLSKHGEFHPFGGAMSPSGEIVHTAAWTGDESPRAEELLEMMEEGFRAGAAAGEYKATAMVYDILTVPPGKTTKQDAIAVALDHRDGYSVVVIFPYTRSPFGKLKVQEPFATEGQGRIFSGSGEA
jgi:hypothetical protein